MDIGNIMMLLIVFEITSALTLTNSLKTLLEFKLYYSGLFIFLILLQYVSDIVCYRRKIKQSQRKNDDHRCVEN